MKNVADNSSNSSKINLRKPLATDHYPLFVKFAVQKRRNKAIEN